VGLRFTNPLTPEHHEEIIFVCFRTGFSCAGVPDCPAAKDQ
jgi:hypothetical protein